jgi:CRP-like cAMP-binding protein
MSIDFKWLEQKVLFTELTDNERAALGCIKEESFKKGERIITQGQIGGTLYILRSGLASVEDRNRADGSIKLAELKEGTIFGELTFLNNENTSADVTARKNCVVYELSQNDFADLMGKQQQLAYTIFARILEHETKIILAMKTRLTPMLRELSRKVVKIPLMLKVLALILIVGTIIELAFLLNK